MKNIDVPIPGSRMKAWVTKIQRLLGVLLCKGLFRSTAKVVDAEETKADLPKGNQKLLNFEEVGTSAFRRVPSLSTRLWA